MKKIALPLIIIFISTVFTACTSKAQTDMIDSNKQDISGLLKTLIEKEKEINNLKLQLEKCQNTK